MASEAPVGVVIRRGPSKRVATLLWDRRTDEFRLGQWLEGRIYERRCDLSPDGRHLIYFAMNGRWDSESEGSWSAVSRAPYLKALAMFPKGDCWHGGGLWTSNTTYWLNEAGSPPVLHKVLHDTADVTRDRDFTPARTFGGECPGVYYPRLLRDGWTLVDSDHAWKSHWLDTFEKPMNHGWVLRKRAHAEANKTPGRGSYWDGHELVHPESNRSRMYQQWEWAEPDGDRLVWAEGGCLRSATVTPDGLAAASMLYDFNGMKPRRTKAPY